MSAIALHGRLALAGLARAPGRTALRVAVVAAAVALLGAMLLFIGNSLRTASASALRTVPLDWQAPVSSYSRDLAGARAVVRQPGIASGKRSRLWSPGPMERTNAARRRCRSGVR